MRNDSTMIARYIVAVLAVNVAMFWQMRDERAFAALLLFANLAMSALGFIAAIVFKPSVAHVFTGRYAIACLILPAASAGVGLLVIRLTGIGGC